jgi:hypothetical protein
MALAPLVAGAASILPPAASCTGLFLFAGWLGAGSQPLLEEQHETELPAWRAVVQARRVALQSGRTVVVEPELHPFASYLWHLLEWRGVPTPPMVLSPWDPEPWAGVNGAWLVATVHRHLYPDGLQGREQYWGRVSARLRPLTQQRFLEAWVIEDPPLPLDGWWPRERELSGRSFMWGGPGAELLLPPMDDGSEFGCALRPAPGADPLAVVLDGATVAAVDGEAAEQRLWIEIAHDTAGRSTRLVFDRARGFPPSRGDSRPLAVQVFEMRTLSPVDGWAGPVVHGWQRDALKIEIKGIFGGESFPGTGSGAWLAPNAVMRLPTRDGRLLLHLWAPRPTPPKTVIRVGGQLVAGPFEIGSRPDVFEVEIAVGSSPDDSSEIEIVSDPYRPADAGLADQRELGVVLSHLEFIPRGVGS